MRISMSVTTTPLASQADLVTETFSVEADDYVAGVNELRRRLSPAQTPLSIRVVR